MIQFDRPFDRVQLTLAFAVYDVNGRPLDGSVDVREHETLWACSPAESWIDSEITIVVDSSLEDVAGNNFREALDHVVGAAPLDIDHVRFPVALRPAGP